MPTPQLDPRDPETRIARLLDDGKFEFLLPRTDCGMVAVTGNIKGNKVIVFASDATIKSGALGVEGSKVIVSAYKAAMGAQVPIIGIWHSGGARLSDGVASLDAFGEVFQSMISASGRIPQLSLVLGPTAGGGAYGPALTDIVVLSPEGRIFVTGPDVVKSVTGEDIDMALLGGPEAHRKNSGLAHIIAPTEQEAIDDVRDLTALFANHGVMKADVADIDLAVFVPQSKVRTYEVHPLVDAILDKETEHIELLSMWAPNMTTIIGRLGGATVGVLANNPAHIAGVLDAAAGEKAARFVRTCDAFGIPLIVIADVQGFLPGAGQECVGVNHLGHHLLSLLLLDDLAQAPDANMKRLIIVGSVTGNTNTLAGQVPPRAGLGDMSGLKNGFKNSDRNQGALIDGTRFIGAKAYKDSKLCNMLDIKAFAERYGESTGIKFSTMYPGCNRKNPSTRRQR